MYITWCVHCMSTTYVSIPYTSVRFRQMSVELFSDSVFLFQSRAVRLSCRSGKRRSQTQGQPPARVVLVVRPQALSKQRVYPHSLTCWSALQRKNGETMNHPRRRTRVVSMHPERDRPDACINVQNSCNWFRAVRSSVSGLPVGGSLPPQPTNFNPLYHAN
jgi:hypothetical protein